MQSHNHSLLIFLSEQSLLTNHEFAEDDASLKTETPNNEVIQSQTIFICHSETQTGPLLLLNEQFCFVG